MGSNIKILIVEDQVLIADYIQDILEENGYSEIYISNTVNDALLLMKKELPDIILMDINVEGNFEGIELSKQKNENASVIFITGQNDISTIENALSCSPETYLTKPIRKIELITAVKIIATKKQRNYIFVKDGYKKIKLSLDEILYIKSDKNYIDIYTNFSTITLRIGLLEFSKQLPSHFKQIHRSIVVNSNYIKKINSEEVIISGQKLPISRSYKDNL